MKHQTKIYIAAALTLFLTRANIALAAQSNSAIFGLAKQTFTWGIGIAALLAAVSFAYGAIQYMFPGTQADGKDRMFNSVIGLALTFASILILNSINPQIAALSTLNSLPSVGGVYLVKNDNTRSSTDFYIIVSKSFSAQGYTKILYDCTDAKLDPKATPMMLVSYHMVGGSGFSGKPDMTARVPCDQTTGVPAYQSGATITISISFQYPGVYFYNDANCTQKYIGPYDSPVSSFPAAFQGNVKCMIIVPEAATDGGFVVWPRDTDNTVNADTGDIKGGGPCQTYTFTSALTTNNGVTYAADPYKSFPISTCQNTIKSALIYNVPDEPANGRTGVTFLSNVSGDDENEEAGTIFIAQSDIGAGKNYDLTKLNFVYPQTNKNILYQQQCKTLASPGCLGEVTMVGQYAVIFASRPFGSTGSDGPIWNKVFTANNDDVQDSDIDDGGVYPTLYALRIQPIATQSSQ